MREQVRTLPDGRGSDSESRTVASVPRVVVAGNGMGGVAFVEQLLTRDGNRLNSNFLSSSPMMDSECACLQGILRQGRGSCHACRGFVVVIGWPADWLA